MTSNACSSSCSSRQSLTWASASTGRSGGAVTKPAHVPVPTGVRRPNKHKDHDLQLEY